MTEVKARIRQLKISPKKVSLVADVIRGMDVDEARKKLPFINKAGSQALLKLLNSAVANAEHNHELKPEQMVIKSIIVNQGIALKRWNPAAFGAAHSYKKHACHVDLVIAVKPGVKVEEKKTKEKKDEKKADEKDKVTDKQADAKENVGKEMAKPIDDKKRGMTEDSQRASVNRQITGRASQAKTRRKV